MSTSWKPAGQSADFSSDITDLLKTLFTGANGWNDTTGVVAEADIVFGTDWWNGYKDYHIHFRDSRYTTEPATNDWKRFNVHAFCDIHVFVRRVTEDRPSQLFNISREIRRIIGQNVQGITGISYVRWAPGGDLVDVTNQTNDTTTWHLRGTIELFYQQVNTA